MKEKVMILGSTGMLGHQVYYNFKDNHDYKVVDVSFRTKLTEQTIILDLNNKQKLENLIKELRPNYIINCVGILIRGANDNPANAIYLNSYLPHLLTGICDEIGAKLVHVSTDCVFSGEKGGYIELDEKDGKDIYSKTKALGEVENTRHITLRTSIIGPELKENGEGLFHWFMQQNKETNGYSKAIWSGVTTIVLAKVIKAAIQGKVEGLHHVTNGNSIDKYSLLRLFQKHTQNDITIHSIEGKAVDKSFLDTRKELNIEIPSYDGMIKEMVLFIKSHPTLYPNYKLA